MHPFQKMQYFNDQVFVFADTAFTKHLQLKSKKKKKILVYGFSAIFGNTPTLYVAFAAGKNYYFKSKNPHSF